MIKLVNKLSTIIVDQVYNQVSILKDVLTIPRECLLCKSTIYNKNICVYCNNLLIRLTKKCKVCRWPIPSIVEQCSLCIDQEIKEHNYFMGHAFNSTNISSNILWTDIKIAFGYCHPIDKIIKQFKYLEDLTKGRLLAELLYEYIQNDLSHSNHLFANLYELPEVIIPVPMYEKKLKNRGFNQSVEIAKYLSKKFNIPIDTTLIAKYKPSDPQMSLNKNQRMNNLEDTFCLNKKASYKSAVIIDDVITTGSTVQALALLLKKIRVKKIFLWALARRF